MPTNIIQSGGEAAAAGGCQLISYSHGVRQRLRAVHTDAPSVLAGERRAPAQENKPDARERFAGVVRLRPRARPPRVLLNSRDHADGPDVDKFAVPGALDDLPEDGAVVVKDR